MCVCVYCVEPNHNDMTFAVCTCGVGSLSHSCICMDYMLTYGSFVNRFMSEYFSRVVQKQHLR